MKWYSLPLELRHPALVRHERGYGLAAKIADVVVHGMGTLTFVGIQSLFILAWVVLNVVGIISHWDSYPFILLNLLFSTQAAYASPFILMAANRQAAKDEVRAAADHATLEQLKADMALMRQHLTEES